MKKKLKSIFKTDLSLKRIALRIGIPMLFATFLYNLMELPKLDHWFYDLQLKTKFTEQDSGKLAILIFDKELENKKGVIKDVINIGDINKILLKLKKQNPHSVVINFDITKVNGSGKEINSFLNLSKDMNLWANSSDFPDKENYRTILKPPFTNVKSGINADFTDISYFGQDRTVRRFAYSRLKNPTFPVLIAMDYAKKYNLKINKPKTVPFLNGNHQLAFMNFYRKRKPVEVQKFISNTSSLGKVENKIVLIGIKHNKFIITPFYNKALVHTKVEAQANAIETLLTNSARGWAPNWVNFILTNVVSILMLFFVLALKPTRGFIALGVTAASLFAISYISFNVFEVIINLTHPVLAIFVCYYFFIPYRLIIENKKSWEYLQKNKLLTQVEELKTNFLRMMSHDLKTPLARIQGMTEVVTADSNPLSTTQRHALKTISDSSLELAQFIGSILNLGRIDGQQINLQLQSRDINKLMQQVVKKCSYLADEKNITLITEYEPLFSLNVDGELLTQVFTNLVENAIKYSPENSKVLITTEEEDGKVMVQVADQGIGISDQEKENVFIKFYRSKDVVNTDIKGSGLGLYLSKYFVNLHNGEIFVESEPQKGSTFTVELPMDL